MPLRPQWKNLEGSERMTKEQSSKTGEHPIDFSTLILSFATSALMNLGIAPDPQTGKTTKNVEVAKQNIEILAILETKTKGNLSPEEAELLKNILAEVRLRFVEASKKA